MKLTTHQLRILGYLAGKDWTSPSEIGHEVGGKSSSGIRYHSNWASPKCLRLVELGRLERNAQGLYRLTRANL